MNNKGSEALFQASSTCKLRLVRMLVEGGTSVNVRNERLETPLILCCQSVTDMEEKRRVVNYLLGKKAKVNLQDINGRTALIHASLSNSGKEIIKALLDAKSNPWVQDNNKNNVFDYVINAGDLETTRLLINACRDSMVADERDNGQMKHLEECLATIQDMRKVSWPLMGPRLRRNYPHMYAAEKEEPAISCSNMLGSDLGVDNLSKSPQPERRRKRSVCHFDPLDIQEILNCNENTETNTSNKENESDDGKMAQRKTSARSLSEEERFSFQIFDSELNAPSGESPGLEKLLKLQDSFSSSVDSNEFPCTAKDSVDDITRFPFADQQACQDTNSVKENKNILNVNEVEDKGNKSENGSSYSRDEGQEAENNASKTDENISEEKTNERERLFMIRDQTCKADSEFATKMQRKATPTDTSKTGLENLESGSNPYTSLVTSHRSSPVGSPLSSPRVTRRQVLGTGMLSPRTSPVTVPSEKNGRDASIVRRYTLSAMDMGKLYSTGVAKTLLVPQVHSTAVEAVNKRRGSATFESTTRKGPEGKSTPPGLRKSKSDMTDWKSISRNLQGKEIIEFARTNGQSVPQITDQANEIAQFQLPSISSSKQGRRSPKEFVYPISVTTSAVENKQSNVEQRVELATLLCRKNFDNDKRSASQSRTSHPSSQKDLPVSPSNISDKSDVVSISTMAEFSSKRLDKTPGDVLPDLLLNCPHQDGLFSRQGVVSPHNFNSKTFTDTTISISNTTEERDAAGQSYGERTSPRLRQRTLLPPLHITNRRSPTHEIEDGYFSGTPSPADVESPRRKYSNEQLRYSFKPISPRSPIPSPKVFALQSGKPPSSR